MLNAWQSASVGVMVVGAAVCFLIVVSMTFGGLLKGHRACNPAAKAEENKPRPLPPEVSPADLEEARQRARELHRRTEVRTRAKFQAYGRSWVG